MEQQSQLDYLTIAQQLSTASIVGIGESTHGTHEFFKTKAEVFKILVTDYGFDALFFESIDDHCEAINAYIQTGNGSLAELANKLFYVYRTEEVMDLLRWLREHHDKHPVRFMGIDKRKYVKDYAADYDLDKMNLRDKRMALAIKNHVDTYPHAKSLIWAHDTHIAAYINPPEWAAGDRHISMGENLRKWFGGDYYSVAQLFGSGYFSAALIEESGAFHNRILVPHYARKTSKYFWENRLDKELSRPTFLQGPRFAGLSKSGEMHYKQALGWGGKMLANTR